MSLRLDAVDLSAFAPASETQWRDAVAKVLKGQPFDLLRTTTPDGVIEPLYPRASDAVPIAAARGAAPWGIVQRVDHPDAAMANTLLLADLEGGATGLDLVFATSPHGHGFGLAPDTDLRRLSEGVMADLISIRISAGTATIARARAVIDALEAAPDRLDISLAHDPVAEAVRAGGSTSSLADVVALVAVEALDFAAMGARGSLIVADGRIWHEAGASRTETLAAQLATAVCYWRELVAAGLPVEDAAARIGFVVAIDHGQFSGIAELRALRLMWARATEAAGLAPQVATIHGETARRMLSRLDANTNMIRNTVAAFAGGIGGVDSLTVLPHSAANGLPDAFSRRIARNTQLILQEEANLHRVVDPGAGSGRVEAETRMLAEAAWALFQTIEAAGGMIADVEAGTLQARIRAGADVQREAVLNGKLPIIGANVHPLTSEPAAAILDLAPLALSEPRFAHILEALPGHRLSEPFEP
jgi:methylmalonyl-CoA mutase